LNVADVGAFCGYYTLLAARVVGDRGHVYAFEAWPGNYEYLVKNITGNNFKNVTAVNLALAGKNGITSLAVHPEADHHWIIPDEASVNVKVPMKTLDDYFAEQGWPRVNFIKIDTEGSETDILKGAKQLFARNPQLAAVIEYDLANMKRFGVNGASFRQTLTGLGFEHGYIIEENMRRITLAGELPSNTATVNLFFRKGDL
jgi:FkbM family methyltransferase